MNVVVVESPSKAKTINKYLGADYTVLASYGHVRDLPPKDGSVRPDEDFEMDWSVDSRAEKPIKAIVDALDGAETLFLATDPDREGEAISWHIEELLRDRGLLDDITVKRVVFHEITKGAVQEAFNHPREVAWRAGRGLSGPPRAGLPGWASSFPGSLAQTARLALCRPRAIGCSAADLRARSRDRELSERRNTGRSRVGLNSAKGDGFAARLVERDGKKT